MDDTSEKQLAERYERVRQARATREEKARPDKKGWVNLMGLEPSILVSCDGAVHLCPEDIDLIANLVVSRMKSQRPEA